MTTETKLGKLIDDLSRTFTVDTRNDGTKFTKLVDDAPEWIDTMQIHAALDDRFPDDWVYDICRRIAEKFPEYTVDSIDDLRDAGVEMPAEMVDIYSIDALRWLASSLDNAALVDEANEDIGWPGSIVEAVQQGQYLAIERITTAIIDQIEQAMGGDEE